MAMTAMRLLTVGLPCMSPETNCKEAICAIIIGVLNSAFAAIPKAILTMLGVVASPPFELLFTVGSMTSLRKRN
jgi:hypothetical protein